MEPPMQQQDPGKMQDSDRELLKNLLLTKTNERVKKLRADLSEQIDGQLKDLVEEIVSDVTLLTSVTDRGLNNNIKEVPKLRQPKGQLRDKVFIPRNSLLTDLFEIKHIQTIHHIFIALLIVFFLHKIIDEYVGTGKIDFGLDVAFRAFGKFHVVVTIWMMMFLSNVCLVYPGFQFWANQSLRSHSRVWNYTWLTMYLSYVGALLYFPVQSVVRHNLPIVASFVVLIEQVRMIMKVHAFIRSNAPKITSLQNKTEASQDVICDVPGFSKFLYFHFAPTLVYRDSYPRTQFVRWKYVASNLGQVLGCAFYVHFTLTRFIKPVFADYGQEPVSFKKLLLSVFGSMMPGTLIFLCGFFCLLHAWMNAMSEVLRFADRQFYKDWWNATSFFDYYRTWNIVVHDWLYAYVYKEIRGLFPSSRFGGLFFVFIGSAVVHEYIISFTFRFFYPLLFLLFGGFGFAFVFLTERGQSRSWNVFMWFTLFMGTGILVSMYSMEWYARINCPPYDDTFLDFLIPRSLVCHPDQPSR